jgi:hypothetical protein
MLLDREQGGVRQRLQKGQCLDNDKQEALLLVDSVYQVSAADSAISWICLLPSYFNFKITRWRPLGFLQAAPRFGNSTRLQLRMW